MAAYKIQRFWFKCKMSPYTKIGRKLINKSYDELF